MDDGPGRHQESVPPACHRPLHDQRPGDGHPHAWPRPRQVLGGDDGARLSHLIRKLQHNYQFHADIEVDLLFIIKQLSVRLSVEEMMVSVCRGVDS